ALAGAFRNVAVASYVAARSNQSATTRLDARRGAGPVCASVPGIDFSRGASSSGKFRPCRGPDLDIAVDQDRWLSGGLRLLPAVGEIRHRRRSRETNGS